MTDTLTATIVGLAEALKPFAAEKLPSLRKTERDYDEHGLRRMMSPMEIAVKCARAALQSLADRGGEKAEPVEHGEPVGFNERRKYWQAIERLLKFCESANLTVAETAELAKIAEEHRWDGLSCYCGGGWLVGHRSGCPEAEAPAPSVVEPVRVRERLAEALALLDKFAPGYDDWMDRYPDDTPSSLYRSGTTFGDIRRARSALQQPEGTPK